MKKRIVAFVVLVALLGGFAQPFLHVSPTAAQSLCTNRTTQCLLEMVYVARSQQEAEVIFASFSSTEQQLVLEAMQPASTEIHVTAGTPYEVIDVEGKAKKCDTTGIQVVTKDSVGTVVATYWQTIRWCWNNKKIKEVTRNRWAEIHAWFYYFNGHVGNQETGGVGQAEYYAWTQGEFSYCPPIPNGCIATWYMQMGQTVRKDGTHTP